MTSFLKNIAQVKVSRLTTDLEIIVLFNFFILVFFTFLGTSIPFQERIVDPYAGETTNVVNQIVYIFLFFSAIIVIIRSPLNTSVFIRSEKFLTIFIAICLISAIWSDYSILSIKRSFQLLTTYITILNVVLNARLSSMITILKVVSILYIVITYYSGLLIPQAIDSEFGTWRGIEIQKNLLGHTALMIFVLTLFFYQEALNRKAKIVNITLSLLAAGLIFLSGSSTNIIALALVLSITIIFYIDKVFEPIGIGRTFSAFSIIFLSLLSISIFYFSKDFLSQITGFFGKDPSFTGRDLIWGYIWNEIQKKIYLGYGFGTYWIMGTSVIDRFVFTVGWKVNEAHSGYLEIMLQLGFIGFASFISLLISFIYRMIKVNYKPAIIVLISILVVNFSESFIFQPRSSSTLVFIFFYLIVTFFYSVNNSKVESIC